MHHLRLLRCLMAFSLPASGCGPEARPEDEPPYLIPDRIEGCSMWCGAKFECGDGPGNGVSFHTEDECIEWCAKPDTDMVGFYYLGNGVDACVEEYNTMANCIAALSCEEIFFVFDDSDPTPLWERPCAAETNVSLKCAAEEHAAHHPD